MRASAHDPARLDGVAEMLKALGHPLRLRIVAALADRPLRVNTLAERVQAPPAIVSQQLRILRMSGLVGAQHQDGGAVYQLTEPRLHRLLACMESHT